MTSLTYLRPRALKDDNLSLVPVGQVKKELLEILKEYLEFLGLHTTISDELPLPEGGYSKKRNQYMVQPFIALAERLEGHNLLVTAADLYAPGLTFIFGYGPGPNAVISIARLKGSLLKERMIKEAVHELGHIFSLEHCPNHKCVMHFSNVLADTDYKSKEFCPQCQKLWPFQGK